MKAVALGETVAAPFDAGEGYTWTVDGEAFDFATAVTGDVTVKAVKETSYTVTVVSTGAVTAEETVTVGAGEAFDFASLEKSGYDYVVISGDGQVITSLTVSGNTTINVIYMQR